MHILNRSHRRIEFDLVESEIVTESARALPAIAARGEATRDMAAVSVLVSRAAQAHFEFGRQRGSVPAMTTEKGPPPCVCREKATGLLRTVHREIVLRFKPGTPAKRRQQILVQHGFQVRRTNPFIRDQVVAVDPNKNRYGEKLFEIANDWAEMDEVLFATPNFVSQFRRYAPPKIHLGQWHLRNAGKGGQVAGEDVDAQQAWKITQGRASIVVAVLDDGVDIDHPNLKSRIWRNPDPNAPDRNGRDFFLPDNHPDTNNPRPKLFRFPFDEMRGNDIHGTPCAGVVAAPGRDSGAVGIAPGCRILPIKIFHADDLARDDRVADAIRYAAQHADILSCSWSGGSSPDIELALEDAGAIGRGGRGAAVFCAAGNESGNPVGFPAADPNAIAVGASTDQARLASYSNVGPELAFVAPSSGGVRGIFTTDVSIPNRGFNVGLKSAGGADGLHTNDFGGTSSATPLAAGVGALVLSARAGLSRGELKELMASTCDKIGSGYDANGHSDRFGFGRVNAGKAVEKAKSGS